MQATNELYLKHRLTLCKLANDIARYFAWDRDDLLSEADLSFLKACRTYDGTRGTRFNTWVHRVVRNGLLNRVKVEGRRHPRHLYVSDPSEALNSIPAPTDPEPFDPSDMAGRLKSERGLQLLDLVLNGSDSLACHNHRGQFSPTKTKGRIVRTLVGRGWDRDRVYGAVRDVKQAVRVV